MMNCLMRNTQEGADIAFPGKAHTNNNDFAAIAISKWIYEPYSPDTANEDYEDAYAALGINAEDFVGISLKWRKPEQVPNRRNRQTVCFMFLLVPTSDTLKQLPMPPTFDFPYFRTSHTWYTGIS